MKVLTVVVTYNRLPLLRQCVACWAAQTAGSDLLVVDNHSQDGTQAYLQSLADPRVRSLCLPENTGGAGGFNAGMRWGTERGYEALWVMDDDTLPHPDALEKLLDAARALDGGYGFLASTALWTDGTPCRMNRLVPVKHTRTPIPGVVEIEQATFVSCLFPTSVIRRFGLPIREFFIWGDDIEFTRRIAVRGGLPGYWVQESAVTHAMADNVGSAIESDRPERLGRYEYAYRNEHYFYRREGWRRFLHYTARCALHLLRVAFRARDRRRQRAGIILRQYFAGFRFHPRIETVRPAAETSAEASERNVDPFE